MNMILSERIVNILWRSTTGGALRRIAFVSTGGALQEHQQTNFSIQYRHWMDTLLYTNARNGVASTATIILTAVPILGVMKMQGNMAGNYPYL